VHDSQLIRRRLVIVGVSVLCLAGAIALAWWQWNRYQSASGTWQNLGYVLQWPLFGLFPAFAFWRLRALRRQHERGTGHASAATRPAESESDDPGPAAASLPAPTAPESEEDAELAEYNRYLAELNAKHERESR